MIRNSAGASETNVDRRERLRKLALETIDLAKVGRRIHLSSGLNPAHGMSSLRRIGPVYLANAFGNARVSTMSHVAYE